jgi:hypothetical protein
MPSLIELFESKKLNSGQTAKEQYDIQNLKPIPIKTNSGAIDLLVTPVNILRRNFPQTLSESRVEQEALGLRQIRSFSSLALYGTAIAKLKLKQSSSVITMKNAGSTLISTDGDLTGIVNRLVEKAKDVGKGALSVLGIKLPEAQIPTRVANTIKGMTAFGGVTSPLSPDKLRQIKETSQGNGAGRVLASIGQGATGQQIKNQVFGAAVAEAKSFLKKQAFGVANRIAKEFKNVEGTVTPSLRSENASYNSRKKYSGIVKIRSIQDGVISDYGNYSSFEQLQLAAQDPKNYATLPEGLFITRKNTNDTLNYANPNSTVFTTDSPFPEFSLGTITQNIPAKRDLKAVGYSRSTAIQKVTFLNKPGKFSTGADKVNQSSAWYSEDGELPKLPNDETLDDYDFIPLRFYSIAKHTGASFKATLSGLEESFSPSWDSHRFVGSPYNFYTYSSVERSVSFTFKVYSLNYQEHIRAWHKLNFLAGLVYPQNMKYEIFTTPPFMKFTIGDMYKNREGFIESLSFSIDDNTPWELGYAPVKTGNRITSIDTGFSTENYKLPTIINVNLTIKLLDNITTVAGKKLYGYRGAENEKAINPDGSAVDPKKEALAEAARKLEKDNAERAKEAETAIAKEAEAKAGRELKAKLQRAVDFRNKNKTFQAAEGQLNQFTSGYENMRV